MQHAVLLVNAGDTAHEIALRALGSVDVSAETVAEAAAADAIRARGYLIVVLDGFAAADPEIREAVENSRPKPLVIVVSKSRSGLPFGDVHVPAPCDPKTLVGVILACLSERRPPPAAPPDSEILGLG